MGLRVFIALLLALSCCALAQDNPTTGNPPAPNPPATNAPATNNNNEVQPNPVTPVPVEDKRIFGVLPNNRTTEESIPFRPLTAGQKMTIAAKDSFDLPVYPTAALFATLYQLENQNPSFGQGFKGYAKRWGGAYGDQMLGDIMTEGLVPSMLHEDPRYFRRGEGSVKSRTWYAVTRIMVTRTDSGHNRFNFSEWGGNAAAVALSNAWYPDTRTAADNAEKLVIQCATDAFSNVLKEFWPDVKRYLHRKRQPSTVPASAPATVSSGDTLR
jgi:hypothetical protein